MDDLDKITIYFDESTLYYLYMSNTEDDVGAIKFINSKECTLEMINYDNGDGWCPLNLAARLNRSDVVEALIKKGADVNHVSWDYSYTPLMFCIVYGSCRGDDEEQLRTIDLLINAGTNLNYEGRFSAFSKVCCSNQTEIIKKLLQHPINIEFRDEDGISGMDYLIDHKNYEAISLVNKYLLNNTLQQELNAEKQIAKRVKI